MTPRERVQWRALLGLPQVFIWPPALALVLGGLVLWVGVRPPGWTDAARQAISMAAGAAGWSLGTCAAIVTQVRQRHTALGQVRAVLAASIALTIVALALAAAGAAESAASPSGGMNLLTVGALLCNVVLAACNLVVIDVVLHHRRRAPEHDAAKRVPRAPA